MVSKFVIWLLSPLGTAFCLVGLALVWLWAWSVPVLSYWLASQIENQFPQVSIANVAPAQAIVLGQSA